MSLKPYFQDDNVTIFHGDAREILPQLETADVVITDPVWPNSAASLEGADRPLELFAEVARLVPAVASRLVVHLGCDSDPRFLMGVPPELPFFRVSWLEYVRPHYKGRLMYGSDVAYAFGAPPSSKPGAHVIPGRFIDTSSDGKETNHPTPRHIAQVKWLLRWFVEGSGPVVDPFMGSGTTLRAAQEMGLKAIGIEINESYCEMAAERLSKGQGVLL